jgi:hypothetical protein
MKKILSSGLVVAGMLSLPAPVAHADLPDSSAEYRNDPRLERLKRFFRQRDCPAGGLSAEFLHAADQHSLDWRLLPGIAMVESGGGRSAPHNNLFGWDNGKARFVSGRAGIHDVARNLANSRLYRHKDVDGILRMYNPDASYSGYVKSVMKRISES